MYLSSEVSRSCSLCRICLLNCDKLVSIFSKWNNTSIAQIINECTSLLVGKQTVHGVTKNDGLPEFICPSCFEKLKEFSEFILKAKHSDQTLRSKINKSNQLSESDSLESSAIAFESRHGGISAGTVDELRSDDTKSVTGFEDNCEETHDENNVRTPDDWKQELPTFTEIKVDRTKFLCCSCFKQFDTADDLNTHCQEVHAHDRSNSPTKTFTCPFCQRTYSSAIAARAHKRKIEAITVLYECKLCGLRTHELLKCQQHARSHGKMKVSKQRKIKLTLDELVRKFGRLCCALGCSQAFTTEEELLTHSNIVHKVNRVESTLTYNEGKSIECHVCFKRFKHKEGLDRHLRFKYKESSNICALCGAKFPTLTSLIIHERSHTREKPFQCEICSKGFGDKQSLKRHYVKHTDEKPFTCSICGISFKRKRAMQSHMIIHEPGQLPFKCEFCEKRFRVKAKLLYHKRTHTGERPYSCRYCEKSFADFSNRIRHEQSHTGEKPYKCSYCPRGFITRRFKVRHEKKHQAQEVKNEERSSGDNIS